MSRDYNVAIVGYSWAATAHIAAIAATSKGRVTDVMSSRPLDAEELREDMPLASFEDGFATHRVIEAADRSVREGKPVKLAEVGL
jgi:predicted dehydrogenase